MLILPHVRLFNMLEVKMTHRKTRLARIGLVTRLTKSIPGGTVPEFGNPMWSYKP